MCLLSTLSEITTYVNTVLRPFTLPILYHVSHLGLSLSPLFSPLAVSDILSPLLPPFLLSIPLSLPITSSFSSSPALPSYHKILPLSSFFPYCLSYPLPSLIFPPLRAFHMWRRGQFDLNSSRILPASSPSPRGRCVCSNLSMHL